MNEFFNKAKLMERLDSNDAVNLFTFSASIAKELQGKNIPGVYVVVGGIFTKEPPRKDIDTVLILDTDKSGPTEMVRAKKGFRVLEDIVKAASKNSGFRITRKIEPLLDESFDSENILRHEGSITVTPPKGTPIEVINCMHKNIRTFELETKNPFVII